MHPEGSRGSFPLHGTYTAYTFGRTLSELEKASTEDWGMASWRGPNPIRHGTPGKTGILALDRAWSHIPRYPLGRPKFRC